MFRNVKVYQFVSFGQGGFLDDKFGFLGLLVLFFREKEKAATTSL